MKTGRVHIRLTEEDADFLRRFADQRQTTVSALIASFVQVLQDEDRARKQEKAMAAVEPAEQV